MGPKERERRLANRRVDRSHRRRATGEKVMIVLILALIFAGVVLAAVLFVL